MPEIIVIYDHPSDFPDYFVARYWAWNGEKYVPEANHFVTGTTLQHLYGYLRLYGRVRMPREPGDDPCVLETWI